MEAAMSHAIIPTGYIPFHLILAVLRERKFWELTVDLGFSIPALSSDESLSGIIPLGCIVF